MKGFYYYCTLKFTSFSYFSAMPRKAKKKPPPAATSLLHPLIQPFASLPDEDSLLKGHVVFVYLYNGHSPTETAKILASHGVTAAKVHELVQATIKSYTNLRRDSDCNRLMESFAEKFVASQPRPVAVPSPSPSHQPNISVQSTPVSQPSLRSTSTPRKRKLQETVKKLSTSKAIVLKAKRRLVEMIKLEKEKSTPPVQTYSEKIAKQNARRRKARILDLKRTIRNDTKILAVQHELVKAKAKIRRLQKKANEPCADCFALEEELAALQIQMQVIKDENAMLQHELIELEDDLNERDDAVVTKRNGKSYATQLRLLVYVAITLQVPTQNIPRMLLLISQALERPLSSVPHRTTIESMARELGVLSKVQAAELMLKSHNLTIGFDATTQLGRHFNSVHITHNGGCMVLDVRVLPGGTAQDYANHIISIFEELAKSYCVVLGGNQEAVHSRLIQSVSNSMTDRCAANHATLRIVSEEWQQSINELYCHLHPLDTMSTASRSALSRHVRISESGSGNPAIRMLYRISGSGCQSTQEPDMWTWCI